MMIARVVTGTEYCHHYNRVTLTHVQYTTGTETVQPAVSDTNFSISGVAGGWDTYLHDSDTMRLVVVTLTRCGQHGPESGPVLGQAQVGHIGVPVHSHSLLQSVVGLRPG